MLAINQKDTYLPIYVMSLLYPTSWPVSVSLAKQHIVLKAVIPSLTQNSLHFYDFILWKQVCCGETLAVSAWWQILEGACRLLLSHCSPSSTAGCPSCKRGVMVSLQPSKEVTSKALLRLYMTITQTPELVFHVSVRPLDGTLPYKIGFSNVCVYFTAWCPGRMWLCGCTCAVCKALEVYWEILMCTGCMGLGFRSHGFCSHIWLTENNQYLLMCLRLTLGKII